MHSTALPLHSTYLIGVPSSSSESSAALARLPYRECTDSVKRSVRGRAASFNIAMICLKLMPATSVSCTVHTQHGASAGKQPHTNSLSHSTHMDKRRRALMLQGIPAAGGHMLQFAARCKTYLDAVQHKTWHQIGVLRT